MYPTDNLKLIHTYSGMEMLNVRRWFSNTVVVLWLVYSSTVANERTEGSKDHFFALLFVCLMASVLPASLVMSLVSIDSLLERITNTSASCSGQAKLRKCPDLFSCGSSWRPVSKTMSSLQERGDEAETSWSQASTTTICLNLFNPPKTNHEALQCLDLRCRSR